MRSHSVDTARLRMHLVESGPEDGIPVALIHDLDPKPPILGTHGMQDIVVADGSPWEMGTLAQIRAVLERYAQAGGSVETELFERSGHFPPIDAAERWSARFFGFLDAIES
jgi:hypothetical protein